MRYGLAFSYLYEGQVDPAIAALQTYLAEYKDSGSAQGFPEVFIWNSIARINLENGRLDAAMKAYEKGYESVPGSSLPEDQKQVWYGRLQHGRCRTLAKMGKHEEAWTEAQKIKKMIDEGGEPAKQYLPAWHYLAGYLKLEAGDYQAAIEELKQANPDDPFHQLLLARAYEKSGDKAEREEDLPRGGRLAAKRPRAGARLPGGEAQALILGTGRPPSPCGGPPRASSEPTLAPSLSCSG